MILGGSHLQREFFRSQLAGITDLLNRLIEISEAVVNLCQSSNVLSGSLFAFCHRRPCLQRIVGLLLDVIELAEVFAILWICRSQRHGFFIQLLRVVDQIGLTKQVRDLSRGNGIVGATGHNLVPDANSFLLSNFQILRLVSQNQLAPVSQKIRIPRCGRDELFILLNGFGNSLIVNQLINERLSQIRPRRRQLQRLFHPLSRLRDARGLSQKASQSGHPFDVFGMRFQPLLIVLDQIILIA